MSWNGKDTHQTDDLSSGEKVGLMWGRGRKERGSLSFYSLCFCIAGCFFFNNKHTFYNFFISNDCFKLHAFWARTLWLVQLGVCLTRQNLMIYSFFLPATELVAMWPICHCPWSWIILQGIVQWRKIRAEEMSGLSFLLFWLVCQKLWPSQFFPRDATCCQHPLAISPLSGCRDPHLAPWDPSSLCNTTLASGI